MDCGNKKQNPTKEESFKKGIKCPVRPGSFADAPINSTSTDWPIDRETVLAACEHDGNIEKAYE